MKYIDAYKLKAWLKKEADKEFKKTEENANSPVLYHFHNGCRMQALDTIDFIESLQQEQPEVDLEKEIERVVEHYNSLANGRRVMKPSGIEKIARHFYELGKNSK
jgi:hypothetical protein